MRKPVVNCLYKVGPPAQQNMDYTPSLVPETANGLPVPPINAVIRTRKAIRNNKEKDWHNLSRRYRLSGSPNANAHASEVAATTAQPRFCRGRSPLTSDYARPHWACDVSKCF